MEPIIITHAFDSSIDQVWNALSNEEELRKWYFPVRDYKFEVGKFFTFFESEETNNYLHRCRFLNIIPKKLIEYSWAHPDHSKGSSVVKWEIQEEDGKTMVTLSHSGVENFADAGPDFARANYEMGWDSIVKNLLRNYLYGIRKLVYEVEINASAAKVWKMLWDKENYTRWAEPFSKGTYYTGELKAGQRVHFLIPSGDGMYSDIAFCEENKLMMIKHIGFIKDLKELPPDAETQRWTGCFETYKLNGKDGKTHVRVEADAVVNDAAYMQKTFPVALNKLKELAEIP